MTEEISSPSGWHDTKHCYRMVDGSYQTLTMDEAKTLVAAGKAVTASDYSNCSGFKGVTAPSTAVMSSPRMGQTAPSTPPMNPAVPSKLISSSRAVPMLATGAAALLSSAALYESGKRETPSQKKAYMLTAAAGAVSAAAFLFFAFKSE
jgi:hypothetical protein